MEGYGLTAQLRRAAVSVASNIAEGCSHDSDKGFRRFLIMSIGSTFEIETQILVINDLKLIHEEKISEYLNNLGALQRQLNSLISHLRVKK
ncbi:MAG: four helix bundle protein [Bacteroidetes bacterium]|nr:four helix bundle protein [Bacteroidota bacterium]